jgi:GntP family gluconate:H+ symporter
MTARTGGRYALNIMAIGAGGAATHVFVPPTPGPLAAASTLGVDLGLMILMGLIVALPGSLLAVAYATVRDRRSPIELRTSVGMSPEELQRMVQRPDGELPGFFVSMLPITLPVILIASRTVADAFAPDTAFQRVARFIGDANIALLASALVALWLVKVRCGLDLGDIQKRTEQGLLTAGPVILITAAGGAYGGILQQAQIGASLQALSTSLGLPVLGLAFLLAAILKIAQGSSTVAIITTSSVLQAMYAAGAVALPHPVYAALAAGAGSLVISWMNDSGFWVVGRMSGFSERETLGTWTVTAAIVGVGGFLTVLLLNAVLPLK